MILSDLPEAYYVYAHVLHHSKKHYVRLTFGEKVMVCEMASKQASRTDVQSLREWAARAFDLPRLPSATSVYDDLRTERRY
ncbi:hypothetical protein JG688_00010093 [Phytophthora aleatoria]|uniref:Uncharacterized protein n=1 Tax=Phytophthora aleatoria TaxID=2496075 RepID=A0A8J5IWH3_9STRA|nr:hypothetical protein JG688_00010093 [Phytophthora aleatoria]